MDPKATLERILWHLTHPVIESPIDQREQIASDLFDLAE